MVQAHPSQSQPSQMNDIDTLGWHIAAGSIVMELVILISLLYLSSQIHNRSFLTFCDFRARYPHKLLA